MPDGVTTVGTSIDRRGEFDSCRLPVRIVTISVWSLVEFSSDFGQSSDGENVARIEHFQGVITRTFGIRNGGLACPLQGSEIRFLMLHGAVVRCRLPPCNIRDVFRPSRGHANPPRTGWPPAQGVPHPAAVLASCERVAASRPVPGILPGGPSFVGLVSRRQRPVPPPSLAARSPRYARVGSAGPPGEKKDRGAGRWPGRIPVAPPGLLA